MSDIGDLGRALLMNGLKRRPRVDVVDAIRVAFLRGTGVDGDPVREVTAYYLRDGHLIGEYDPHEDMRRRVADASGPGIRPDDELVRQ